MGCPIFSKMKTYLYRANFGYSFISSNQMVSPPLLQDMVQEKLQAQDRQSWGSKDKPCRDPPQVVKALVGEHLLPPGAGEIHREANQGILGQGSSSAHTRSYTNKGTWVKRCPPNHIKYWSNLSFSTKL